VKKFLVKSTSNTYKYILLNIFVVDGSIYWQYSGESNAFLLRNLKDAIEEYPGDLLGCKEICEKHGYTFLGFVE